MKRMQIVSDKAIAVGENAVEFPTPPTVIARCHLFEKSGTARAVRWKRESASNSPNDRMARAMTALIDHRRRACPIPTDRSHSTTHHFPKTTMVRALNVLILLSIVSIASSDDRVDFNFDIKPILSDRCYVCHGPDQSNREADLRLDLKDSAFAESQSGNVDQVLAKGNAQASELFLRISSDDPDLVMPPPDSNLALSPDEVQLIKRWIDQGADWKSHWSFLPIPEADQAKPLPDVIDELIEKQLSRAGFKLSPLADKRALLRRLSFDITGLPPNVSELEGFLADESPKAYEKVVDRLLSSERFGERVASVWLDAARYSDTYGYQVDRERYVWPYRDWVIRQFNNNLPYDEFIIQQLAGDLLPNATDEMRLATAFNRLHPQKVEGGSVPEEFRIEYVADRTQTFATSMLGLTLECARCHDHKYDPISQKEYYQLTAFFDNVDEAGLYSYFTSSVPTPTLLLGDDAFKENKTELLRKVEDAREAVAQSIEACRKTYASANESAAPPPMLPPVETQSFDDWKPNGKNQTVEGIHGKAVKLSGDDAVNLKQGNFARYEPFSIALWVNVPKRWERTVIFHRSRAWTDAASRGYECLIEDGHLTASLIHFWPGNAISIRMDDPLPINAWQHITLTYDGSSQASGLRIYVNGEPANTSVRRDNLYKEIRGGGNDHISIGQRFRDTGFKDGLVDEFQVFDRELQPAEVYYVMSLSRGDTIEGEATPEQRFELELARNEGYQTRLSELQEARKAACELQKSVKEIMVMEEMSQRRKTFLLRRGDYTARADEVFPETMDALPPMEDLPRNRLGLAQWMVSPQHPLTARVATNRLWQMLFGTGLVRTPEDFGSQGQLPTHPALLDRLARDFIDHGWDTKRFVKQLVLSRTYRQVSDVSPEMQKKDPENRLYGRAPSYRWPAEMLRDQALAVSGLLVDKIGGPPVKPYDLKQSFKPMEADKGDGLYRRSLYTYWKRTGPSPAMMALDAAKRDVCRVQRSRTSSPLQTLVLMNGPQFVEAARFLATSVIEQNQSAEDRLRDLFQRLTSRPPSSEELIVLSKLYVSQLKTFQESPDQADAYLQVGTKAPPEDIDAAELAAAASVANALLGLDEVMMKK